MAYVLSLPGCETPTRPHDTVTVSQTRANHGFAVAPIVDAESGSLPLGDGCTAKTRSDGHRIDVRIILPVGQNMIRVSVERSNERNLFAALVSGADTTSCLVSFPGSLELKLPLLNPRGEVLLRLRSRVSVIVTVTNTDRSLTIRRRIEPGPAADTLSWWLASMWLALTIYEGYG